MNTSSLYYLGRKIKEYVNANWIILGSGAGFFVIYLVVILSLLYGGGGTPIFLGFIALMSIVLLGGSIYLLIKFLGMMNALRDTAHNLQDNELILAEERLRKYFNKSLISVGLSITIIGICPAIILMILGLIDYYYFTEHLKTWSRKHQIEGADNIQLGWILQFFLSLIGTIVMNLGFSKFADEILLKFPTDENYENQSMPSYISTSTSQFNTYQYGTTQAYHQQPQVEQPRDTNSNVCPSCGSPRVKNARFCGSCGQAFY